MECTTIKNAQLEEKDHIEEKTGADWGLDQPRKMLSVGGGELSPKALFFVLEDKPLSYSVSADYEWLSGLYPL